jgi:hypothetical protein
MTFGRTLTVMLQRIGYSLLSEFVTADGRAAVRLRDLSTSATVSMYHTDAVQLARGEATVAAILHRNRSVFPSATGADEDAGASKRAGYRDSA